MKTRTFLILIVFLTVAGMATASQPSGPAKKKITGDRILIEKSARSLTLLDHGSPVKKYRIALGKNPVGTKEREGDNKTPEGLYRIDRRNRHSRFHRALHISYPTAEETRRARGKGASPGGNIMIHGLPDGYGWLGPLHASTDWTLGCIAVTNEEIEEIWDAVPDGTVVEIRP